MSNKQKYETLQIELAAIEKATGLYLADPGVDHATVTALREQNTELAKALRAILDFDSMDYGMHIRGMQKIARDALAKTVTQS